MGCNNVRLIVVVLGVCEMYWWLRIMFFLVFWILVCEELVVLVFCCFDGCLFFLLFDLGLSMLFFLLIYDLLNLVCFWVIGEGGGKFFWVWFFVLRWCFLVCFVFFWVVVIVLRLWLMIMVYVVIWKILFVNLILVKDCRLLLMFCLDEVVGVVKLLFVIFMVEGRVIWEGVMVGGGDIVLGVLLIRVSIMYVCLLRFDIVVGVMFVGVCRRLWLFMMMFVCDCWDCCMCMGVVCWEVRGGLLEYVKCDWVVVGGLLLSVMFWEVLVGCCDVLVVGCCCGLMSVGVFVVVLFVCCWVGVDGGCMLEFEGVGWDGLVGGCWRLELFVVVEVFCIGSGLMFDMLVFVWLVVCDLGCCCCVLKGRVLWVLVLMGGLVILVVGGGLGGMVVEVMVVVVVLGGGVGELELL